MFFLVLSYPLKKELLKEAYHNNELVIKYIKIELISLMNQRFKQIKIKYKGLTFKMYSSLGEIIKNNIKNNSGFNVICY